MVVIAGDVEFSLWMTRIDSGVFVLEGGFEYVVDRGDQGAQMCACGMCFFP